MIFDLYDHRNQITIYEPGPCRYFGRHFGAKYMPIDNPIKCGPVRVGRALGHKRPGQTADIDGVLFL
jgi:hypothetical protein